MFKLFHFHFKIREIIGDRSREETNTELAVSVYDTGRNEKAKLRREELVRIISQNIIGIIYPDYKTLPDIFN